MTAVLQLSRRKCSQCLCTRNRIVSKARAREILVGCRDSRNHFVCHKAVGEIVHCRGVHDLFGSRAFAFAAALGIPVVEVDMDGDNA